MATLQKIRNNASLLVSIVIGLAMVAFILGDLLSTNSTLFTRNQFEIAEVGKQSIDIRDYNERVEELAEIYKNNSGTSTLDQNTMDYIRETVFNEMVDDIVLGNAYKAIGLDVSKEELFEIIQGDNPHPIVQQIFANPQTGQLNKSQLLAFWQSLSQDETGKSLAFAKWVEQSIYRDQLRQKYINLVKKGLFVTDLHAKVAARERNKKVDFQFLSVGYSTIPDSTVELTDKDIKKYYDDHQYQYRVDESRDIAYVVFDVIPTEEDYAFTKQWIEERKDEFSNMQNVAQYVRLNSDVPYRDAYQDINAVPQIIKDSLFYMEEGTVIGPYFDENAYKISKLLSVDNRPDSARASHILLQPGEGETIDLLTDLADSLKNVIQKGEDIAELALIYSKDPGSAQNGGDLGWFSEGRMVPQFNEAVFEGTKGDVVVVQSQFGVHIIKITEQAQDVRKIRYATLARNVEPGNTTIQVAYSEAIKFQGLNNTLEKFNKSVSENSNLTRRMANNLKPNDKTITGLTNPRQMVVWAYSAEKGDVSDIFEFENKYVVAALTEVREKGIAPLESVYSEVELNAMKQKKGETIVNKINAIGIKDIESLASELSTGIKQATNISFSAFSVPQAGVEPKLIATAVNLDENEISKPIIGTNGVYVVQTITVTSPEITDEMVEQSKQMMDRNFDSRANYEAVEALKEAANIEDHRVKFF